MKTQQLEIGLQSATATCRPGSFRQRRMTRARWWFSQMRRVVNEAIEWQPSPAARPEQAHLPLAE